MKPYAKPEEVWPYAGPVSEASVVLAVYQQLIAVFQKLLV